MRWPTRPEPGRVSSRPPTALGVSAMSPAGGPSRYETAPRSSPRTRIEVTAL